MGKRQFILAALFVAVVCGQATDNRKMSAYVRELAQRQEGQSALSRATGKSQQTGTLTAFVRIDADKADEVWRTYGCKPYAVVGDIAIVSIPKGRLGSLSDHPAVRRIEASPSGRATMDTTAIIVGADRLYRPSPLPISGEDGGGLPFTGQDVIIGVMDIGFDLTHPNFYDQTATRYRIKAFWDQLSPDTTDSQLPVGRDFIGPELVRAQLHSTDGLIQTHGTHTLGIAAGSGYRSPYQGIAPEADICLVSNAVSDDIALIDSADIDKYTSATDALGFKYIFDYADRQGKPCVASFSEGYPSLLDQEDSLFAAFLDSITGPGRIIVASAGNECIANTYFAKPAGQKAAGTFVNAGGNTAYYRAKSIGPDGRLTVYAYTDATLPTDTLVITPTRFLQDSVLIDTLFLHGDTCAVSVERYPSTFTADTIYTIQFTANKPLSALPPMAIVAEGTDSSIELYGSSSSGLANRHNTDPRWNAARSSHNIHAPACFPSVVCVGATAHRFGFTNYKGEYREYADGRTKGRRSPYSSIGPTMSGLTKPDVMAPGDNIISSYSSYYIENNPDAGDINSDVEHFEFQGRTYAWNANTGTSMATPVVAGVIALWLQAKPDLTREEVIDALSHTCRRPDDTRSYPNIEYGYGEIDAYSGMLHILGIDDIEAISHQQPRRPLFYQQGTTLRITATSPGTLSVHDLSGRLLRRVPLSSDATMDLSSLPAGIYAVQTTTNSPATTGSTLIRLGTSF